MSILRHTSPKPRLYRFRLRWFGLGLGWLALAAHAQFNGPPQQATPQELNRPATPTTDRHILFPGTQELHLAGGDLLNVRIFGQPDYTPTVRIAPDGTASLPLAGIVPLAGLSISAAETTIADKLIAAGMYRNPQVTVQVTEGPNAVVTVVGEAHAIVPVNGPRKLLDVLTSAGGLPPTASHVLTIDRPGQAEPIVVDLGTDPLRSEFVNVPVFPGDTVVVSRLGIVYMVGAFKTPGTIPLTAYTPLTLMQATALSGGITFEGKYDDLRIIRTVGDKRTLVKVDVKSVLYGRAPDPILQPNDIVFLPSSALKASIGNGSLGTLLGVLGLVISIAYR